MNHFVNRAVPAALLFLLLTGCQNREEKIQAAVETGAQGIAQEQRRAADEIGKAKAKELESTTGAANRVAEAQRSVATLQVESVQTAAVADAEVTKQQLVAAARLTKANNEAERLMEQATKP